MDKLTSAEALELLGMSPESVAAGLNDFANAARVLSSDRPKLIDEHPQQWVGVYHGRVAATGQTLDSLLDSLLAAGVNTSGRPYIEAYVSIPGQQATGFVSFLLDTGADHSVIMYVDVKRLGIDYKKLGPMVSSAGIGGQSHEYIETGILAFLENNAALHVYRVPMRIAPLKLGAERIPSLLGRDILDRWNISFDKSNNLITAQVLSADATLPVNVAAGILGPGAGGPPRLANLPQ